MVYHEKNAVGRARSDSCNLQGEERNGFEQKPNKGGALPKSFVFGSMYADLGEFGVGRLAVRRRGTIPSRLSGQEGADLRLISYSNFAGKVQLEQRLTVLHVHQGATWEHKVVGNTTLLQMQGTNGQQRWIIRRGKENNQQMN